MTVLEAGAIVINAIGIKSCIRKRNSEKLQKRFFHTTYGYVYG